MNSQNEQRTHRAAGSVASLLNIASQEAANMALTPIPEAGASDESAQALHILGEYLELALDVGGALILTQPRSQACVMYIGDPAGAKNNLQIYGTIEKVLADAILLSTNPGVNFVKIGDQPYRFIRSFTHIDGHDAVVFSVV